MKRTINFGIGERLKGERRKVVFLSIVGYTISLMGITTFIVKNGYVGEFILPAAKLNIKMLTNYIKGHLTPSENIILDIKHKNILKISNKRNDSSNKGYLITDKSDWVKGIASYKNKIFPLKIRLKGMSKSHWEKHQPWSYKLNLKGNKTIMGMQRFAIQHPRHRGYMNEWHFHKISNYLGLIAPRYKFTTLTINGKRYPIYAIEENFDKRLIENNRKKAAPIFMLTDKRATTEYLEFFNIISFYQKDSYGKTKEGTELMRRVERLIKGYMSGNKKASEVFDLSLMAKAYAITDLFGNQHSINTGNMRFYINPHSGLIEPIPFDQGEIQQVRVNGLIGERYIDNRVRHKIDMNIEWWKVDISGAGIKLIIKLFNEKEFTEEYIQALKLISEDQWLEKYFESVSDSANRAISTLHRSYPWYSFKKEKNVLYANRDFIKSKLNPSTAIKAYMKGDLSENNYFKTRINNNYSLPVEILGFTNESGEILHKLDKPLYIKSTPYTCIDIEDCSFKQKRIYKFTNFEFNIKPNTDLTGLRVLSRVYGSDSVTSDPVYKTNELDSNLTDIRYLNDSNFAIIDESKKSIVIKQGYWTLNKKIFIPKDYLLTIRENTTIDLIEGAAILSYSPLNIIGSYSAPIIFTSTDGTGQGLVISNVKKKSIIRNAKFTNLNSLSYGGVSFTGSLTSYESNIDLEKIFFSSNSSEDAINLIRSEVSIQNSTFKEISSDAIDLDFCNGTLTNLQFSEIGNDGIDFSGSNVNVENIVMSYLGDKGISVGEKSNINLAKVNIDNAFIGIASKDSSSVRGKVINISNSNIGIASYNKKNEYGPSSIKVDSTNISTSKTNYLVEKESNISIDGEIMSTNIMNLYNSIYK